MIFRFVYIVIIGYALAGVILHASTESKDEKLASEGKPFIPPFLGYVEATIVLGSVVALFAAFVVIQFQYFFGGTTNIHIDGYTYAEYARRGFGELVAVAFFALLMLLTLSAVTKRETETQRRIFSGLGVALVALLLVMLFSAFKRLGLYEEAYGFSRLRTYTHVFLIWLGLLLIVTIALEILRKEHMFTFAMLIAALGFAISLPILNVDAFIVESKYSTRDSCAGKGQHRFGHAILFGSLRRCRSRACFSVSDLQPCLILSKRKLAHPWHVSTTTANWTHANCRGSLSTLPRSTRIKRWLPSAMISKDIKLTTRIILHW